MIAATNALAIDGAKAQGQRPVAAAVFKRAGMTAFGSKKHNGQIEERPRDPLARLKVRAPARDIPAIVQKRRRFGRDASRHDSLLMLSV